MCTSVSQPPVDRTFRRESTVRLGNPPAKLLICEFECGDEFHKGPILELYPDGFFVETTAVVERATALEVRLFNPATGEEVSIEVIVEPTALAPRQPRGLQLRIFHLTPAYSVLIGAMEPRRAKSAQPISERIQRRVADSDWASSVAAGDAAESARPAPSPRPCLH